MVREAGEKQKFLCGHDERHWFVAAIPESAPVGTVRQAKEALKPAEVRTAQARCRIDARDANRRKNDAFIRQGEWFFLPEPTIAVDAAVVLRNEPLSRGGGGKPHWTEFCFRSGGETVYACAAPEWRYPVSVSADPRKGLAGEDLALAGLSTECGRVRARPDSARRSQNRCAQRLASRADEHGESSEGDAQRGVFGLRDEAVLAVGRSGDRPTTKSGAANLL